ncbi:MAG: hypothetical protein AAGA87_12020 [Pseudomonadota bacterium]
MPKEVAILAGRDPRGYPDADSVGAEWRSMTALTKYQRLEATGVYDSGDGARRDAMASLGTATLTITVFGTKAVTHWSLAAVRRVNPGAAPAVFAPASDSVERLEVSDDEMVRAIETVRSAVAKAGPHPGRLRGRLTLGIGVALLAAMVVWLPGALTRKTASLVPEAARAQIGEALLGRIAKVTGMPCDTVEGEAALAALLERLGDAGPKRALIVPDGVRTAAHVPGGTVLLGRSVVEDHESPAVVAGYLLAEAERSEAGDPLVPLLDHAGLRATVTLATTGRLPDWALDGYPSALLTTQAVALAPGRAAERFAAAGVPISPYAYAVDITGEQTLPLIEADRRPVLTEALLPDGSWVALQGICE